MRLDHQADPRDGLAMLRLIHQSGFCAVRQAPDLKGLNLTRHLQILIGYGGITGRG